MWAGIIFAAIAAAWLAYLVPSYLRGRETEPGPSGEVDRFADSMRVVARGTAPLVDHDGATLDRVEVSTPVTRRAAVRDIRRLELLAASRRRRVLLVLMIMLSAMIAVCVLGVVPWWALVAPGGLLIAFVVISRISVTAMHRASTRRFESIMDGSDEATIYLSRPVVGRHDERSVGIDLAAPVARNTSALWDPLPITKPTYVSTPLAPRTVRTIDLSSPEMTSAVRRSDLPVTADGPATADRTAQHAPEPEEVSRPRAVGE